MADLPAALQQLAPVEWEDVPRDDLARYMTDCFGAGELLCNSVPPPPNGTPFESSTITNTTPNAAKSAAEMHASSARSPARFHEHEELQKKWGKPTKFNKKDNPLDVALYKMAGHDRNGAWFARYNVLEGMGFEKFKKAMRREFPETLLEQGAPGAGAKRGLSADRRVERKVEGVGQMEVLQLSAQMPSPVSPREFVTLLLSSDDALTEKSAHDVSGGDKYTPRHFMVVSKPLEHPDTPNRPNFVKGRYESVELIREIPLHTAKNSRPGDNLPDDPELNPVEWIMITRSDPGGGIPRFLVDRGTPEAMLGDVTKFLDWACPLENIPDADVDEEKQQETSNEAAEKIKRESTAGLPADEQARSEQPEDVVQSVQPTTTTEGSQGGLMSTLTSTAAAYTPAPVSDFVERRIYPDKADEDDMSDSSDSSSIDSFVSAEMRRLSTAPEYPEDGASGAVAAQSTENLSIRSTNSDMSHQDKEVAKLLQQREKLDRKLAKKRAAEQERFKQSEQKEETERGKAKERMDKELKKTEDRHRKEMEKLDAKREKEAKKAEQRRQKRDDQSKLSFVARERDEARSQLELFKRENQLLSDQVEILQRENTALAAKLGKVAGSDVLKAVQEEIVGTAKAGGSRKRGHTSTTSSTSKVSLESGGSGERKE